MSGLVSLAMREGRGTVWRENKRGEKEKQESQAEQCDGISLDESGLCGWKLGRRKVRWNGIKTCQLACTQSKRVEDEKVGQCYRKG